MSREQVIAKLDAVAGEGCKVSLETHTNAPALQSTPANLVTVPASELRAMREEIERLRQGYWDARAVMGFDNDGDPTPAALVSDMVHMMAGDAASMRRDYDEACTEADDLRTKLSALLAGIAGLVTRMRNVAVTIMDEDDSMDVDTLADDLQDIIAADDLKAFREGVSNG